MSILSPQQLDEIKARGTVTAADIPMLIDTIEFNMDMAKCAQRAADAEIMRLREALREANMFRLHVKEYYFTRDPQSAIAIEQVIGSSYS